MGTLGGWEPGEEIALRGRIGGARFEGNPGWAASAEPLSDRNDPMNPRARIPALGILCLALLGRGDCPGGNEATGADALTRRQRDSLVSELPVPGSGGVRGAMDAADAIEARNAQLDSMR